VIIDLAEATGLPVALDQTTCRLAFRPPLAAVDAATRPTELLRAVYRDPLTLDRLAPDGLYFMYDGVALLEHREALARAGLRYDLTVLRPITLGDEPVKTLGHYHTLAPDGLAYPELYQVVWGCAHFVLQLAHAPDYRVEKVIVVEARAGEAVLMPPGWGHVSINAGDTALVMCNWIADACGTVPGPYLDLAGAACYEIRLQGGDSPLLPNPRYGAPCPEGVVPIPAAMSNLLPTGPIYATGVADIGALQPLVRPSVIDWRST
jgi:oxalate decarboxylase/phosphoglucose isomerase-like protein (cupin superfamily)